MSKEDVTLMEKLMEWPIQHRPILYGLILIMLIAAMLFPIGLPLSVTKSTRNFYDIVEKLSAGSTVFYAFDVSAASYSQQEMFNSPVLKQILSRPLKVIGGFSFVKAEGSLLFIKILEQVKQRYPAKKYGVDYVAVGYYPGGESALAAAARDLAGLIKNDAYGTSSSQLPLLSQVKGAAGIDLLIAACDMERLPFVIRQWVTPYGTPLVAVLEDGSQVVAGPYLSSGQIKAAVIGVQQAAEYELLIKDRGSALGMMDAQTLAHVIVLCFIVFANVCFISGRLGKRRASK